MAALFMQASSTKVVTMPTTSPRPFRAKTSSSSLRIEMKFSSFIRFINPLICRWITFPDPSTPRWAARWLGGTYFPAEAMALALSVFPAAWSP